MSEGEMEMSDEERKARDERVTCLHLATRLAEVHVANGGHPDQWARPTQVVADAEALYAFVIGREDTE